MTENICIFHHPCIDGFTSAVIINDHFRGDVEFHPGVYGDPPPDVRGKRVILADFSYPREVIEKMGEDALSVLILDHHKTAAENLAGFPPPPPGDDLPKGVWSIFDMDRSGAGIAADYFWKYRPVMVNLVEDRDLWRFKYGQDTKRAHAYLETLPKSVDKFSQWECILGTGDLKGILDSGEVLLRGRETQIRVILEESMGFRHVAGYDGIPVANCSYMFSSEVCAEILKKHPDAPFAATWILLGDGRAKWSFRSQDHREDVSAIAARYGGGGHRNASGLTATRPLLTEHDWKSYELEWIPQR